MHRFYSIDVVEKKKRSVFFYSPNLCNIYYAIHIQHIYVTSMAVCVVILDIAIDSTNDYLY